MAVHEPPAVVSAVRSRYEQRGERLRSAQRSMSWRAGMATGPIRRWVWLPIEAVQEFRHDLIRLCTAKVDLREFVRRHGEVELGRGASPASTLTAHAWCGRRTCNWLGWRTSCSWRGSTSDSAAFCVGSGQRGCGAGRRR
jgi:hypothetical protein